jgi:FkbM family methyltransferase
MSKKTIKSLTRLDKIRLNISRNWEMPGRERIASMLVPKSKENENQIYEGITWLKQEYIAVNFSSSSYIEWKILSEGNYEPATGDIIRMSLQTGETALDVGANIGVHTLRMAQSVGKTGRVIACEPLPHLQLKLQQNIQLNRFENIVEIVPAALSDYNGRTNMSAEVSSFNQGTGRMDKSGSMEADVFRGDDLLEKIAIENLAMIKIDVEGYEMKVIEGLKQSIRKYMPRIIVEYDAAYWKTCNSSWQDLYDFLNSMQYSFYRIDHPILTEINGTPDFSSGNILCMRKNIHLIQPK